MSDLLNAMIKDHKSKWMLDPVFVKSMESHNIIQDAIQQRIKQMQEEVEEKCRAILIKKGIARADFTPYQWRRLGKLIEPGGDGVAFYMGEDGTVRVYKINYYEPPQEDWFKMPKEPFTIQFGHYEVIEL